MDPPSLTSIFSATLDLPPSCVEFHPTEREYFVVGTYNLEANNVDAPASTGEEENSGGEISPKHPQKRSGSLLLFCLQDDRAALIQTIPTPSAILDIHFNHACVLAAATSTGSVSLFQLKVSLDSAVLEEIRSIQFFDPSVLVLSLACHPTEAQTIAMSLSTGEVAVRFINGDTRPSDDDSSASWTTSAHSLEAWTVVFGLVGEGSSKLYSGGDDSKLALQILQADSLASIPLFLKGHTAGVTAILPLASCNGQGIRSGQDVLVTGSYDEYVRIFVPMSSTGTPLRYRLAAEERLGGGVWRLRGLEAPLVCPDSVIEGTSGNLRVLASCMHAGARLLDITWMANGQWAITVLAKFEEHESMNYGSDVQPLHPSDGQNDAVQLEREIKCVSTSFYDRKLCIWKFDV